MIKTHIRKPQNLFLSLKAQSPFTFRVYHKETKLIRKVVRECALGMKCMVFFLNFKYFISHQNMDLSTAESHKTTTKLDAPASVIRKHISSPIQKYFTAMNLFTTFIFHEEKLQHDCFFSY